MTPIPRLPPFAPGMRIGLLGGSFNPPHEGHALITRLARRRLALDRVWWLVTPGNPLKSLTGLAALKARIEAARRLDVGPRIGQWSPTSRRRSGSPALYLWHASLARASRGGRPFHLDHGRRQPSPVPSLASLALDRRAHADRRRRSAGLDFEGDLEPRAPRLRVRRIPRARRFALCDDAAAGASLSPRAALLDCPQPRFQARERISSIAMQRRPRSLLWRSSRACNE